MYKNISQKTVAYDNQVCINQNQIPMFIMWYGNIDINLDVLDHRVLQTISIFLFRVISV